jgi:hypothetical protein
MDQATAGGGSLVGETGTVSLSLSHSSISLKSIVDWGLCRLGRGAVEAGPRRRQRLPSGGHRLLLAALLRLRRRLHAAVSRLHRAAAAPHRPLPLGQGSTTAQQVRKFISKITKKSSIN